MCEEQKVYLRHRRFPIGSNEEHEILAAATCCVEEFQLIITDVAGNTARIRAHQNGSRKALLKSIAIWGSLASFVVIVLTGIVIFLYRRKKKSGTDEPRIRRSNPVGTGDETIWKRRGGVNPRVKSGKDERPNDSGTDQPRTKESTPPAAFPIC